MINGVMISPVIRGLTFDGRSCLAVVYDENDSPDSENRDRILHITDFKPDNAEEQLKELITKYKSGNGVFPESIVIKGEGTYRLGNSYNKGISGKTGNTDCSDFTVVNDRVSVVTGGAQGFGEEIVRQLVSAGSLVFIADLNINGATAFSNELNTQYKKTVSYPVKVNVADEDSVEAMLLEVVQKAGGVDLFINNAGVLKAGSVKKLSLKDFNFVTSVNYIGYFICAKAVSKIMALQNKMSTGDFLDIIQINSKSGLQGSNRNGAYSGGKFGGIGLTQSFALELIEDRIKVNSICPGNFFDGPLWSDPDRGLFVQYLNSGKVPGAKTVADVKQYYEQRVPMKRGCTGEDVMKAIYYIIDQKYETGQAVPVTGGQVMLN